MATTTETTCDLVDVHRSTGPQRHLHLTRAGQPEEKTHVHSLDPARDVHHTREVLLCGIQLLECVGGDHHPRDAGLLVDLEGSSAVTLCAWGVEFVNRNEPVSVRMAT